MHTNTTYLSRRKFITLSTLSALSIPLAGQSIIGANSRIRVGIIGCGIRGRGLTPMFYQIPGVEIAAICDPDSARMDELVKLQQEREMDISKADKVQDYRRILDNPDIDVVAIASPNHWHVLHAIQAMQAGKDVYLEKPATHTLWEGKQLLAAVEKYGSIVAVGHQNRSDPGPIAGIKYVQDGNLGKILSVNICCFKNRDTIGKLDTPLVPPATVDYNLWLGPAQDVPIYRPRLHYDWHWVWNTGNGDTGNQAPHEIDMACWVLGDKPLPKSLRASGGRFGWNDAGETPNIHTAWYTQGGIPCILETNNLTLSPDRKVGGIRNGVRTGIAVNCEGGQLRGGRGGMYAVGEDGKTPIKRFPGDAGEGHQKNFIDAVRSRDSSGLTATVANSERSAAIAHLSNLSVQAGKTRGLERVREAGGDNPLVETALNEQAEQLKNWGLDDPQYTLGMNLKIDPSTGFPTNEGLEQLVRKPGRDEFVVPELA